MDLLLDKMVATNQIDEKQRIKMGEVLMRRHRHQYTKHDRFDNGEKTLIIEILPNFGRLLFDFE